MKDNNHSTLIELIDDIIHTEYEISSCINSCKLTQGRALNLIDTIKCHPDSKTVNVKASIFQRLKDSIASSSIHNTNEKDINIILPLINNTLHSIRVRLERGLTEQEMLNTFHSSPKKRKHSLAMKHAIRTRAFIEKLQYLKAKLNDQRAERAKIDLMVTKYQQSDNDENCIEFLIEERMKIEIEIDLLKTYISKVKKQLARQYGSGYSKNEYQSLSEDVSSSEKDIKNDDRIKRSIGVQTCSAESGFKNDHTTQTVDSAFKTITLSTQTRSILRTDSDKENKKTVDYKNWFRQDLELPSSIDMKNKYLTRWYFNIDNRYHQIEIKFTDDIRDAPQVYLDKTYIDFAQAFKTFRRIFDKKNWRILIKLYPTTNITIKSVNGGYYKLMIDGMSFDKLKQNIVEKQWE